MPLASPPTLRAVYESKVFPIHALHPLSYDYLRPKWAEWISSTTTPLGYFREPPNLSGKSMTCDPIHLLFCEPVISDDVKMYENLLLSKPLIQTQTD